MFAKLSIIVLYATLIAGIYFSISRNHSETMTEVKTLREVYCIGVRDYDVSGGLFGHPDHLEYGNACYGGELSSSR